MVFGLGPWPLIPYRGSFLVLNLSSNVKKDKKVMYIKQQYLINNHGFATLRNTLSKGVSAGLIWCVFSHLLRLTNTEVGINKREINCSPFLIVHLQANAPSLSLFFLHVPTLLCLSNPTWWLKKKQRNIHHLVTNSMPQSSFYSGRSTERQWGKQVEVGQQFKWLRVTWVVNNKTQMNAI